MDFNVDSHFVIGKSHIRQNKPCQDHALCSHIQHGVAMIVSDGCSTGDHTDTGARLVTNAGIRIMKGIDCFPTSISELLSKQIIFNIETSRFTLGLKHTDMLATCAYGAVTKYGGFIQILGDGCIAVKYVGGFLMVIQLEWQNNMPYYPIYQHYGLDTFIRKHEEVDNGDKALKVSVFRDAEVVREEYVPIREAIKGYTFSVPAKELEIISCIGIFSDGVTDFALTGQDRLPVTEVVKDLLAFKNTEGEFVKRRLSMALKNYAKQDIFPNDDISMAVINIKQDADTSNDQ